MVHTKKKNIGGQKTFISKQFKGILFLPPGPIDYTEHVIQGYPEGFAG